jgi:hypothetical protein
VLYMSRYSPEELRGDGIELSKSCACRTRSCQASSGRWVES